MKALIGLVTVDLLAASSARKIEHLVACGMEAVPVGRCLVVIWTPRNSWGEQIPIDSIVTKSVLGVASSRPHGEFEFFANGTTRMYSVQQTEYELAGCLHWLIFRRGGDRAYARRKNASKSLLERSNLPALHKAFTRDVANNVWHLPARSAKDLTLRRLEGLLAWSDESVVTVQQNKIARHRVREFNLKNSLIGVAMKQPYERDRALGVVLL